jgi:hypothetical protein
MAIDLTREQPIPLADVPKLDWVRGRGGKRLHVASVHRWCSHGIRGVRLEFVQRAGARVTSKGALLRFFQRLTRLRAGEDPGRAIRTDTQVAAVEQELDTIGISAR